MKFKLRAAVVVIVVFLSGCVAQGARGQLDQRPYYGPKATISVATFKVESRSFAEGNYARQRMSAYLSSELVRSNRFIVTANSKFKKGLVVYPKVVDFYAGPEKNQRKRNEKGVNVIEVLGAVANSLTGAYIVVDFQLIDARNSRILATTRIKGRSSGALPNRGKSLIVSGWAGTAKDQAFRDAVQQAVVFISVNTPENYYSKAKKTQSKDRSSGLVKEMQLLLNQLGYGAGQADGLAGKVTRQAVKDFQVDHGLSVTGRYNKTTMGMLRKQAALNGRRNTNSAKRPSKEQTKPLEKTQETGIDLDSLSIEPEEATSVDLDSL